MSWDKFVKRYVWDDVKTPYFVATTKMNKVQAGYEIFAFSLFLVVLFLVISLASLSDKAPQGRSGVVSILTEPSIRLARTGAAPTAGRSSRKPFGYVARSRLVTGCPGIMHPDQGRRDFRKKAWIELVGLTFFLLPFTSVVVYFAVVYAYDSWVLGEISASLVGMHYRWVIKSIARCGSRTSRYG